MEVTLLAYTPAPLKVIYTAARTCYSARSPAEIWADEVPEEKMEDLVNRLIQQGHHSVLEHVSFTLGIAGISRSCLAQLTRHRVGIAFSVQSQRYVRLDRPTFVTPPSLGLDGEQRARFEAAMAEAWQVYNELISAGVAPEDARFVLPNAATCNLVLTVNIRELIHICELRLCPRAQWEIHQLFLKVTAEVVKVAPFLKRHLVPKCLRMGYCDEPESCGIMPHWRELQAQGRLPNPVSRLQDNG
jgi:thymidylate synthase (FAD)